MKHWLLIVSRDLHLSLFKKGYFFNALSFFIIISFILYMNLSFADKPQEMMIVMLVSYIITCTLSSSSIFQDDYMDSSLEQLLISGYSSLFIVTAKITAYWVSIICVLTLNFMLCASVYDISFYSLAYAGIVFVCNALVISCITAFSGALTLKIDKNSVVNFVITVPLTVIFLLYSATILSVSATGLACVADLRILIALTLIVVPILVCACSYLVSTI